MKLTLETIQQINLFENITKAKVRDCIDNDELTFIIEEGNIKKALGKDNANIKTIQRLLKKDIKLIAFSKDPVKFLRNLIYPSKADSIELKDNILYITTSDNKIKGRIYGRGKEKLKKINIIIKKYFNINEVRII